jgi:hypothetical protein
MMRRQVHGEAGAILSPPAPSFSMFVGRGPSADAGKVDLMKMVIISMVIAT